MMTFAKTPLLALLCLSSAGLAQVTPPVAPVAAPIKEKKICRSEVPLGSIMGRRICHTKAEWVAIRAQNGAAAERTLDAARRPGMGTTSTN
jgi:predicted secreted protein